MDTSRYCWICTGTFAQPWPKGGDVTHVDCATCGAYTITDSLLASAFPLPNSERYRLSFWCMRRKLEQREPAALSTHTIDAILPQLPSPQPHEKSAILMVSLTLLHPEPGKWFRSLDAFRQYSLACARNDQELQFSLKALIQEMYLESNPNAGITITQGGWEWASRLRAQPIESTNAFVALWFNDEMLDLFKTAFAPAIKRAGFEPRLANEPKHNDQIDARIIAELKQSRFVVADVTGGRNGVYFEAGYAIGIGRPVIWTCKRDSQKDMHFDTRQYNHILWDGPDDLSEELYYRIVATI